MGQCSRRYKGLQLFTHTFTRTRTRTLTITLTLTLTLTLPLTLNLRGEQPPVLLVGGQSNLKLVQGDEKPLATHVDVDVTTPHVTEKVVVCNGFFGCLWHLSEYRCYGLTTL